MVEKVFFQSSMPRSGSTLLQNIIAQNPDFYATPTSGLLELLFGARANFSSSNEFKAQDHNLVSAAFKAFCREGMFGYFNSITDKKYVIDKSRGWGAYKPFLDSFYPESKVVCMVRDLRSILSSYEKIYRKNQATSHDPIRNDSEARGTTVHKRVDSWVHPTQAIGRALERIFDIIRQKYDNQILFVKYEELCIRPDQTMSKIYSYLELPNFIHDFDNIKQVTKEDDTVYGLTPDLHVIKEKLSFPKKDHNDILGADISDWIYSNFKWYFDRFGYQK